MVQGWCGAHTLSSGAQVPSLLMSLLALRKAFFLKVILGSKVAAGAPATSSAFQEGKKEGPCYVLSQKNKQTTSIYSSLVTTAVKEGRKCSLLYRHMVTHNKISVILLKKRDEEKLG